MLSKQLKVFLKYICIFLNAFIVDALMNRQNNMCEENSAGHAASCILLVLPELI